jgi:hypothetical protein
MTTIIIYLRQNDTDTMFFLANTDSTIPRHIYVKRTPWASCVGIGKSGEHPTFRLNGPPKVSVGRKPYTPGRALGLYDFRPIKTHSFAAKKKRKKTGSSLSVSEKEITAGLMGVWGRQQLSRSLTRPSRAPAPAMLSCMICSPTWSRSVFFLKH